MTGEQSRGEISRDEELTQRLSATEARIAANEAKISDLQARADRANHRADTDDLRAASDRDRIWALEGRANVDALLIAELQADGLVAKEQAANLEAALHSSRTIGAAIGILMARHNVSEAAAFQMLRAASMAANRKLLDVADEVVLIGELATQDR